MKRLVKTDNKMIFGVCGALGAYFDIDATLVRVGFVLAALALGTGLLAYIILAILIPSSIKN